MAMSGLHGSAWKRSDHHGSPMAIVFNNLHGRWIASILSLYNTHYYSSSFQV